MISFEYDKDGDIFEIKFSNNKIKNSEFIKDSGIVVDYDKDNMIVSLEVTSFSKRVGREKITDSLVLERR